MKRLVASLVLVLACASNARAVCTTKFLAGFESQTTESFSAGSTSTTSPPDGTAFLTANSNVSMNSVNPFPAGSMADYEICFRFRKSQDGVGTSSSGSDSDYILAPHVGGGTDFALYVLSTNKLTVGGGSGGASGGPGTTTIANNTWYKICVQWVSGNGNPIKVWVDGTLDINGTHGAGTGSMDNLTLRCYTKTSNVCDFDSLLLTSGCTMPISDWKIIGRQGTSGAPTYDNLTETCASCSGTNCSGSCTTATGCCAFSEPGASGTAKFVTMTSQTGSSTKICAFNSASCTGYTGTVLGTSDTLYGCANLVNAKRASGTCSATNCYPAGGSSTNGSHCIFWRFNSTDYYYNVGSVIGTGDSRMWSTIFVPGAFSYLDAMEVGMGKATCTGRDLTLEDLWVECAFTPAVARPRMWVIGQ